MFVTFKEIITSTNNKIPVFYPHFCFVLTALAKGYCIYKQGRYKPLISYYYEISI